MLVLNVVFALILILLVGSGIGILIVGIKKIVSLFKEVNKTNNSSYRSVLLISLFLPSIGLLIYAFNVGNNEPLSKWALRGFKMNLLLLFMLAVIMYFIMSIVPN